MVIAQRALRCDIPGGELDIPKLMLFALILQSLITAALTENVQLPALIHALLQVSGVPT